jgi:hypothetical protein
MGRPSAGGGGELEEGADGSCTQATARAIAAPSRPRRAGVDVIPDPLTVAGVVEAGVPGNPRAGADPDTQVRG